MFRAGGFHFPECDVKGGAIDGTLVDDDNVQLCQRKNQLSRRLRLARQAKVRTGGTNNAPQIPGGEGKKDKKGQSDVSAAFPLSGTRHISAQARVQMQMLLQHSQRTQQSCVTGTDTNREKKRKDIGGEGVVARNVSYEQKSKISLSEDDEVSFSFFCLSACQFIQLQY